MLTLDINGKKFETDAEPDTPLLWVLRDHLGMTGSKYGCGKALCGACTARRTARRPAVVPPVSAAATMKITTIEAVGNSVVGRAVQDAWIAENVLQCGYCQSGQVMSATALLTTNKKPTDADIDAPCPAISAAARPTCAFVPRSSAPPALWPEGTS